jgi:hypothetical protein
LEKSGDQLTRGLRREFFIYTAFSYQEPPFALLAKQVVSATEHEEPPLALLASAME